MALAGGCRLFLENRGSSYHQQNRNSQGIALPSFLEAETAQIAYGRSSALPISGMTGLAAGNSKRAKV